MGKNASKRHLELTMAWEALQVILPFELLHAPLVNWAEVNPTLLWYLYNEAREAPWLPHLAFCIAILTCHTKLDRSTIRGRCYHLQARFRVLFPHYHLSSFEQWDANEHVQLYLNDTGITDSLHTKQSFLQHYHAAALHAATYLRALPESERFAYQRWVFPDLPWDIIRACSQKRLLKEEQQQRRKEETDALAPHFSQIRGEAYLRWNQLKRLRDKFAEAVALVESGQETLPLLFSYEEPRLNQDLSFRLWDRYSFFEHHTSQYARTRPGEYVALTPENNHFFLELISPPPKADGTKDASDLLWFGDLLHYELLGKRATRGSEEELQRKQDYLRSWGYGEYGSEEEQAPFNAATPGILTASCSQGHYLYQAQKRLITGGRLFLIEPLYAGATFGLAALDLFTTTGARHSEVLQISLDPECLYTVKVEGVQRYLMRMVPKNAQKIADYIVGAETRKMLEKVGSLLQEHYRLQSGESIPSVPFNAHLARSHQFPRSRPYLFQYEGKHFPEFALSACIRFLLHGLVFQTAEGRTVTMKAHSLRHVFATHLHQVEAVPLDIIAVMLHQKNVQVTAYYAAPPWQQVLATANSLLDKFATHLGSVDEAFVRAPAELQRQVTEAKATVGSLNNVPGGECTCHAICPIAFACTGCVYHVPDPEREEEIIEQEQWALVRLDQVKRRGLGPEIVKMQALIQRCHVTRHEMQLMRIYQKDEAYEPTLTITRDK